MEVDYQHLIDVARKTAQADLVIENGKIVNVFSGEIYPGGIVIAGDRIAAVGDVSDYLEMAKEVIDARESFIAPGLIDGHVHIESSMLGISRFAELALAHGTTSVMSDLHEVAVVGGLSVIREILDEAERALLKVYFVIPSHVPFSPGMETTGGVIGPQEVREALDFPRSSGLSEIVVSSALGKDPRLWEAMDLVRRQGKLLHGHGPFTYGGDLAAFAALGIHTDHEAFTMQEGIDRLRAGIHLQIRQGSAAESLPEIIKVVTQEGLDPSNISVITDDILADDLYQKGYQDVNVRLLQEQGLNALTAIQMVTFNAARAFRLEDEIGVIAPGRQADLVMVESLEEFKPARVLSRGILVKDRQGLVFDFPPPRPSESQLNSIHLAKRVSSADFEKLVLRPDDEQQVKVNVLDTPPEIPVPELKIMPLQVVEGVVQPDPENDIAAIAVVERHRQTGNIALGFVKGYQLQSGAIASSVAHDHHNIIAIGTNYADLAFAVNRVADLGGGQVVVQNGKVLAEVALPILGLMSPAPVSEVCEGLRDLTLAARELGCGMRWPHMFMSFMSCSGGPGYSITDMGLLDGYQQEFLSIIAGEE